MNNNKIWRIKFIILSAMLVFIIAPSSLVAKNMIGPRAGIDLDSDNVVIGIEAELGRAFQNFRFAPSLDFELGDNSFNILNSDFRLYLFNLPETGLRFYGSVGPTLIFGNGSGSSDIGLSLTAGVKVPMKNQNRYHLECRFGFGDVPDMKLMFALLFGI